MPICVKCQDYGWQCEAHPQLPFEHDVEHCTGPGEPCNAPGCRETLLHDSQAEDFHLRELKRHENCTDVCQDFYGCGDLVAWVRLHLKQRAEIAWLRERCGMLPT